MVPLRPLILGLVLALAAPSSVAQAAAADATRRAEILDVAVAYATHEWQASEANVLHGPDEEGVHVDTPDESYREDGWRADGSTNVGVPYQWGGFIGLDQFDAAIEAGRFGGHLPGSGAVPASSFAVGVDCSGFVSRCWDLPLKQSTRSLGRLCYELDSYDDLQPGDIINKYDQHVMLFKEFVDADEPSLRVYEATIPRVMENVYTVRLLESNGYIPLRYKPLDERWDRVDAAPASFAVTSDGEGLWTRERSGTPPSAESTSALATAPRAAWVRYEVSWSGTDATASVTRIVASNDGAAVDIQESFEVADGVVQTTESFDATRPLVLALLDFQGSGQPLENPVVEEVTAESGTYVLGGRRFEATRIVAELSGVLTVRREAIPQRVTIEAIVSEEAPLLGVLQADYRTTLAMEGDHREWVQRFTLAAFHGGDSAGS